MLVRFMKINPQNDDLINLTSQTESKVKKIKFLEGKNSELQDEKTQVKNLLR